MCKRNTRKERIKENKKFPYKTFTVRFPMNERDTYAVVDEDNIIIEKFRLKTTAMEAKRKLEVKRFDKLRVLRLN